MEIICDKCTHTDVCGYKMPYKRKAEGIQALVEDGELGRGVFVGVLQCKYYTPNEPRPRVHSRKLQGL